MLKKGFAEDVESIFQGINSEASKKPQTLLFSATIPNWLKGISQKYQTQDCTIVDMVRSNDISIPKTIKHFKIEIGSKSMTSLVSEVKKKMTS